MPSAQAIKGFPKGKGEHPSVFGYPLGTPVDPPSDVEGLGIVLSTTRGATMAAPGAQNTKTAWTSAGKVPFDAKGFYLSLGTAQHGAGRVMLVDVAVGPVGQEQIILADFLVHGAAGGCDNDTAFIPLRIRAGDNINFRMAQRTASALAELDAALTLTRSSLLPSYKKALTYGAVAADTGGIDLDPGAVAHTKGSWVTISSSIGIDARALLVNLGNRLNLAMTTSLFLFDVAVGPAGQERVIIENVWFGANATNDQISPRHWLFPVSIRAGTRVAMRTQANLTDATDRLTEAIITVFGN